MTAGLLRPSMRCATGDWRTCSSIASMACACESPLRSAGVSGASRRPSLDAKPRTNDASGPSAAVKPAPSATGRRTFPTLLRRVHATRGASGIDQAQPKLSHLLPPDSLSGMDAAVRVAHRGHRRTTPHRRRRRFRLRRCDRVRGGRAWPAHARARRACRYAVPNRMVHGYGLSPGLVDDLAALQPDLLVTVDHGIACHAGIAAAKARGWQVLVTDHHLPGPAIAAGRCDRQSEPARRRVPEQDARRRRRDVLCPAGVAPAPARRWGASAARPDPTFRRCSTSSPSARSPTSCRWTRTIARWSPRACAGCARGRAAQDCARWRKSQGATPARLSATDIGFGIAPRINAAGRLEDMALGIECLLSDDAAQARELASTLNQINGERRARAAADDRRRRSRPCAGGARRAPSCRTSSACSIRNGIRASSAWSRPG